jgi:plastocyanin
VSPKLIRLLFVATVVTGVSAPMLGAQAAPERRSVDTYNPPKGFEVFGAADPKILEIFVNDEVTWNIMEGEHQITPEDAKRWGDSGSNTMKPEDSGSYIADNFRIAGDYAYYCKLHEDMTGIIRVKSNAPPPPPPPVETTTTTMATTTTTATRPGATPPATSATAPTTRPTPTTAAPTTTTKPDKGKKPKDETTTTTIPALTPPPPPVDIPDEAIIPTLPGLGGTSSANPGADAEAPGEAPEGEAVALLKAKKDNGGDAMKLLIVSGLGLGLLGFGTAGYKYANRSSKYFPA